LADDALRSAVHDALYRVAVRAGAGEIAAIEAADAECAALDAEFGAARHYWPAQNNGARQRAIAQDLAAGLDPNAVALKHGVSRKTVTRARREPFDDNGFGGDGWVLK
jgi:DNA-binding NarL/FixJ family response regulator